MQLIQAGKFVLVGLVLFIFMGGCNDLSGIDPMPEQPTAEQIVENVAGTWRVIDMYTGTGRESNALDDLELTFTVNAEKNGGEFVANNGSTYFAPSGQWTYNGLVGRAAMRVPQMTFVQTGGSLNNMEFFHERNDRDNGVPQVLVLARTGPNISINMYRVQ